MTMAFLLLIQAMQEKSSGVLSSILTLNSDSSFFGLIDKAVSRSPRGYVNGPGDGPVSLKLLVLVNQLIAYLCVILLFSFILKMLQRRLLY